MTRRTLAPFRADHVGSLLRPKALLEARARQASGEIGAEELRHIEDEAIQDIVTMQREVGLQSATDGEFRRTSWHMDFIYQLGGVDKDRREDDGAFRNEDGELDFESAALQRARADLAAETIFGERSPSCAITSRDGADAEADDPVAEHGPLPRRPGGDRRDRLPGPRRSSGPT